jgi:hypothetical protein
MAGKRAGERLAFARERGALPLQGHFSPGNHRDAPAILNKLHQPCSRARHFRPVRLSIRALPNSFLAFSACQQASDELVVIAVR